MAKTRQSRVNDIDRKIASQLHKARLDACLTQAALAERIGFSAQQVQKYEAGIDRISSSRLWALAKALRLPITYFFETLEKTAGGIPNDTEEHAAVPDRPAIAGSEGT
jgi:transcriptional regulator with XRE-family HTH domain